MIVVIPDVLSVAEARRCVEKLEKADWREGRYTAGPLAARVKDNLQLADDDPLATEIGVLLLERLAVMSRFVAAALPLKVVPPRFNLYASDASYGDHIDSAVFGVPDTSIRIRADMSATLFLSDPDEYDGGELTVMGEFAPHQVKLPAGHMVLYSSGAVHHVEPVTRGARFAAFFWIQSLVRENDRRSMLLELDDTIQALAADTPDNPAVARLTGLYHNLLRDWAVT
ncbi:Fe2+-dependent dioxygenase [Methylocystis parvus]|uniref:Fe2+-dependent dioxygenase n=1 Tax=Methylocystis parvus TaxID=134 RepID=A0A6B8M7C4_9HYPH|nr:Fe2+-dependent dioxygenase [Methylocystis parvus]QGM97549.1 Fe2+-dependent dioxygenase [Methylocystis parvus]WBJ98525.1 Fe2+-dependent dioxygenase [Methylocystis parvus OBBP]